MPANLVKTIRDIMERFGKVRIERHDDNYLKIVADDPLLMTQLCSTPEVRDLLADELDAARLRPGCRSTGESSSRLSSRRGTQRSIPAGYTAGRAISHFAEGRANSPCGRTRLWPRDAFYRGGSSLGGSGVIALPSGSGKTVVGMAVMALVGTHALIITTGVTAVRQWIRELLDKTRRERRFHRRIQRARQRDQARDGHHLPDPHIPQTARPGLRPFSRPQ